MGDHLHGDVLGAHERGWVTFAVVEELESSVVPTRHCQVIDTVAAAVARGDVTIPSESSPRKAFWGDFFTCDEGKRQTYFGHLIQRIRCTAVSDVALLPFLLPAAGTGSSASGRSGSVVDDE